MSKNQDPSWKRLAKPGGWVALAIGLYLLVSAGLGFMFFSSNAPDAAKSTTVAQQSSGDQNVKIDTRSLDESETNSDNISTHTSKNVQSLALDEGAGGTFLILASIALLVVSRNKPVKSETS